jgi:uncharacterized membrane protein YkvA (DUF1232 family)
VTDGDRPPPGFERFRRRAERLLGDPEAVRRLGRDALDRVVTRAPGLGGVVEDLRALIRLMTAWARGEYREVPTAKVLLVIAAVLYFVVPVDLIPDVLVGVGLVDDVAVIGWVTRRIRGELEAFRRWEAARRAPAAPPAAPVSRDAEEDDP